LHFKIKEKMISIKNLKYAYSGEKTLIFPDFDCKKGEQMLILGQSGCGKSTLLQLLGGILTSQQGEIIINQQSVHVLKNKNLDVFRGKNIGFIFQQHHFLSALTVEENLLLAQSMAGAKKDKTQIHALLERLNIAEKSKAKPDALSIGEQQRVAIARAIVHRPAVILADEPTSALDDKNTKEVIALLKEQAQKHESTLIIVTHDQRLKENFVDKTLFL
jgi:ABC-type lipoprotein export system ATPase subunit